MSVTSGTHIPTSAWRQAAQAAVARATKDRPERLPEARRDFATVRLAECIEREMAKAPPLRPDQLAALKAIISGTDPAAVLPDVVAARPADATSAA